MLAARGGAIVNVSSVMTRRGQPGQVAYVTSKGAIEAFTRALALELGPRGIRVNAVVPGVFATGMSLAAPAAVQARWLEAIPMRRLGEPDELAKAVHWLASADASYITGATLVVDGGLSL
jgi:3-oxoacyl-[acyl-carrier protein] reductase